MVDNGAPDRIRALDRTGHDEEDTQMSARLMASVLVIAGGLTAVIGTIGTTSDVTVRMTAGMAYGIGLIILAISMWIARPRTRATR